MGLLVPLPKRPKPRLLAAVRAARVCALRESSRTVRGVLEIVAHGARRIGRSEPRKCTEIDWREKRRAEIITTMPESPMVYSPSTMRAEKRSVAGNSVLAAFAITTLQIVVGVTTGSLGILSEAAHSALDLVAAIITLFSVRVSDKPADADHQYGHGKVENFSAFLETGLLLVTCVWIISEAIKRLFFHSVEIEPSVAAYVVMILSIAVDAWRSRALGRIALKYDSQALEADALHFSTDIWSSSVVIVGLALVLVGRRYQVTWLRQADPIAALFVAGVVV